MKLERSKNAIRSIVWGMINKVVNLLLPFFLRTVLIYSLGAEFLGLNSLFTSILTVLNLAELGFSSAVVFSMYEPIAKNDTSVICALMGYYRKVYARIGVVVLSVGFIVMPFLSKFINGAHPAGVNIYSLYMLFLLNTSISYFLFAYKVSILTAHQREDILSKVDLCLRIFTYSLQAISLFVFQNYYVYIIISIIYTILNNIVCAYIANRIYPQYRCSGKLDKVVRKGIKKNIGGLMIGKLCLVSRNSFDNIFISAFLGLGVVAVYGNYYYIMNAIAGFLTILMTSIGAGVGNSVATETVEKNYNDMNKISFLYQWIAGWCTVCLLCLYQPFMIIWMGNKMLFPMIDVILICLYFYFMTMGDVRSRYANAAGLFWESKGYILAEAIANVCLNYILGKFFGVHGIIFATMATILIINFGWGSHIVFKKYFVDYKISKFFENNLFYFGITLVSAVVTYFFVGLINNGGWGGFLVKCFLCLVIPNTIFFFSYCKTKIYKDSKSMIRSILRK